MANTTMVVVALLVAAALASGGGGAAEAAASSSVSCSDAVSALIPCGSFLIGAGGDVPTQQCCQSVQSLNKQASSPADRQALCRCFQQTGPSFGVRPEYAQRLPSYCKLQLKVSIGSDADCSKA